MIDILKLITDSRAVSRNVGGLPDFSGCPAGPPPPQLAGSHTPASQGGVTGHVQPHTRSILVRGGMAKFLY